MSEETQVVDMDYGALASHLAKNFDYEEIAKALKDREMPEEITSEIADLKAQVATLKAAFEAEPGAGGGSTLAPDPKSYTFGEFLIAVRRGDAKALKAMGSKSMASEGSKDLIEGSGLLGGYTVPTDQRTDLLSVDVGTPQIVRPRATVLRTNRASLTVPVLDQFDTPASASKVDYFGGVVSYWTEEGATKTETEPNFNQLELKVHKLAGYTQASDELLADSATALDTLLRNLFAGAIQWREDWHFLRGTGVGQPLGILNCGSLMTRDRLDPTEINLRDLGYLLESFLPSSHGAPSSVWVAHISTISQFIQLADAGNNVVWIDNARDTMPMRVFGMPILFTEKVPVLGTTGDLGLYDLRYYYILDNGMTEISSSIHYAFINDMTTWRFVHRVDGQCMLSAPIYIDTTTQVSPFVVLHANTT